MKILFGLFLILLLIVLALIVLALASCADTESDSAVSQPVENAVCNLPFPVECYPFDDSIQCSAACAPQLGYCPEYPPAHVQACQDWCRFGGPTPPYWCEPYWCVPTYPRHCLQGEAALTTTATP